MVFFSHITNHAWISIHCHADQRRRNAFQADPQTPDWKKAFYGANYDRLYAIKRKFDPHQVFYAPTAVGSDDWQEQANGALCWAGKP